MSRILDFLSQTSPDEEPIPGTNLPAARVKRVLAQLRERVQHGGKAGQRAGRLLEFLEGGGPDDPKFEGVSIEKLKSAIQRARAKSLPKAAGARANDRTPARANDRAPTGNALQGIVAEVSQGDPSDTWVDGVNVTRLEKLLARLQHRAGGAKALDGPPVPDSIAPVVRAEQGNPVETASLETQRAVRTQGKKADRQREWIQDFIK